MKKLFLAAAIAFAMVVPANAKVYNYACHYPDDFKLHAAKVDTAKKTITWKGFVYKNLKEVTTTMDGGECPKVCFQATGRDGIAALNTATQGVASLSVSFGGPGTDGVDEAECDLVRQ
jgi:hypothetical protein